MVKRRQPTFEEIDEAFGPTTPSNRRQVQAAASDPDVSPNTQSTGPSPAKLARTAEANQLLDQLRNEVDQRDHSPPAYTAFSDLVSNAALPFAAKRYTIARLLNYTSLCERHSASGQALGHGFTVTLTDGHEVMQANFPSKQLEIAKTAFENCNFSAASIGQIFEITHIAQSNTTDSGSKSLVLGTYTKFTICEDNNARAAINQRQYTFSDIVEYNLSRRTWLYKACGVIGYIVPESFSDPFKYRCDCGGKTETDISAPRLMNEVTQEYSFRCAKNELHPIANAITASLKVNIVESKTSRSHNIGAILWGTEMENILGIDLTSYVVSHMLSNDLSAHISALLNEFSQTRQLIFVIHELKTRPTLQAYNKILHFQPEH